ncbi:MAG: septum formation initiator family protein [Patescibacteria group bacterium]
MLNKHKLSSKTAIFGLIILAGFLGVQEYKQLSNQKKIETQKKNLQDQADALSKKNNDLSESLQKLNSLNFKEKVARQQLNLKKDGETVYSFADASISNQSSGNSLAKQSNFIKWWRYFFAN